MPPNISVVMSVLDGARFLPEAITSILDQTYQDFEFIIIDDGSTDSSREIIKSFAEQDDRIRLLENSTNIGLAASLNRGITEAQGQYIARMDADDICYPERFERQIEYLEEHPAVGVLGSRMQVVDVDKKPLFEFEVPLEHSLIVWNLFFGRTFAHPSVMMRTEVIRAVGGYNEEISAAQDIDLWSRLVGLVQFRNLSDTLMLYRSHADATSIQKPAVQRETITKTIHALILRLLGWDIASDFVEPIIAFRHNQMDAFTVEEREMLITEMKDLFIELKRRGWLLPDELELVLKALLLQIDRIRSGKPIETRTRRWVHLVKSLFGIT